MLGPLGADEVFLQTIVIRVINTKSMRVASADMNSGPVNHARGPVGFEPTLPRPKARRSGRVCMLLPLGTDSVLITPKLSPKNRMSRPHKSRERFHCQCSAVELRAGLFKQSARRDSNPQPLAPKACVCSCHWVRLASSENFMFLSTIHSHARVTEAGLVFVKGFEPSSQHFCCGLLIAPHSQTRL